MTEYLQSDYIIQINANLNNQIVYDASANPPVWGLSGGILTNTDLSDDDITFVFPETSTPVLFGTVDAGSIETGFVGEFDVVMNISTTQDGKIGAVGDISGENVIATVEDKQHYAQYVYWSNDTTIPSGFDEDSADVLTKSLSSNDVKIYYQDILNSIAGDISGNNVLDSWSIQLSSVTPGENNITSYARDISATDNQLFENGQSVILDQSHQLLLIIQDVNMDTQVLIDNVPIYAVITHYDSGTSFL